MKCTIKHIQFFLLIIFVILSDFSFAEPESKPPRVVTINIGFECEKECPKLKGVKNDLQFFESLAESTGSLHTINIGQEQFDQFPNKAVLLERIKKRISEYDTVVFNYSGHGLPFPKDKSTATETFSASSNPKNYDFLLMNEKLAACLNKNLYEKTATCNKSCRDQFGGFKCTEFTLALDKKCNLVKDRLLDKGQPYFVAYMKCRNDIPKKFLDEVNSCRKSENDLESCRSKCWSDAHAIASKVGPITDAFESGNLSCVQNFGLLSSDFEKVFTGKKVYGYVDSCYSGLMSNFNHPDAVITMSSGFNELSVENKAGSIGEFTKVKKDQLGAKYCKYPSETSRPVTLSEYYQLRPNLLDYKLSTSTISTAKIPTNEILLKGYYHCEQSPIAPPQIHQPAPTER